MQLSVIIATKNRASQLPNTLSSLKRQSLSADAFEVLVVDNGSQDHTGQVLQEYQPYFPHWRHLFERKPGAAAARNSAIRSAQGEILLFLDDDIVADSCLVEQHLSSHNQGRKIAVLGSVRFPWSGRESAFFHALQRHPELHQSFAFPDPQNVPFLHFYTCNLSIPRRFFEAHGLFDEDFSASGFEDIDMGYRFVAAGNNIIFNAGASALHDVRTSFAEFARKRYAAGQWLYVLLQKQPQLAAHFIHGANNRQRLLARTVGWLSGICSPFFGPRGFHMPSAMRSAVGHLCWYRLQYYFWSGFRDASTGHSVAESRDHCSSF